MTGLIKETLTEQADAVTEPSLDLDALMRTGDRRIRRRRIGTALTAVAASIAVVAGGLTVAHLADTDAAPAEQPGNFAERRPTYAKDGKIHFGSETIDVGKDQIAAFAQTDAGFVYVTPDGTVKVANGRRTDRIGSGARNLRLTVDDNGPLVGWVDTRPKTPEFVLYDVATRREVTRTAEGNRPGSADGNDPVLIAAIDNGTAYFGAADGLRRWNIATGKGRLLKAGTKPELLKTVGNGLLVWERTKPVGPQDVAVGTDINTPTPATYDGWSVTLSPEARYLTTDMADEVRLFDLETRQQLPLKFPGYVLIVPTQWQGDGSFYAVGFTSEETAPLDLLKCSTSKLDCTVAVPHFAKFEAGQPPNFQFPVGYPLE